MLQQDLLLTLAEISVTIAALSAVAGVVQREGLTAVASGLLRDVAIIGMLVALFALLPLIFWNEGPNVLRICSAGAAILWLIGYAFYLRGVFRDRSQISAAFWIGMIITLLGVGLFAFCALSSVNMTYYTLALLAWLAIAGLNFVASVFANSSSRDK